MESKITTRIGLSPRELAANSPWSKTTIYRLIRRGDLRAVKCGRRLLIPAAEIRRLAGEGVEETA